MKNKGFTLTELMATIVILGLVISLTTGAYISVTKSVKQNNYNSKINYIKTKALEYAEDNNLGTSTITVSKLIVEGYITKDSRSDRENESITNPLGGYLDCYKINITLDNNEYSTEVEQSMSCVLANDESLNNNVSVEVYKSSNMTSLGSNKSVKWSGEDVVIYVKLLNGFDTKINKAKGVKFVFGGLTELKSSGTWATSPNKNHTNYDNEFFITAGLLLNDTYEVVLYTKDNQEVIKEFNVKIDKEAPTLNVDVDSSWSNSTKKAKLYGSDGSGSGLFGYYVGNKILTEAEQKDESKFTIKSTGNAEKSLGEGIYYVYARDNVGNVSTVSKTEITNIDTEGASCKNPTPDREPNANGWYNNNVTITYGCNADSESGCYTKDTSKTYSSDNRYNETITWQIKDTVGNTNNCTKGVSINLDKTKPACTGVTLTTSSNENGWYNHDVVATYGCASDNLSGCDYAYSQTIKKYTSTTYQNLSWQIRDYAYNTNTCTGTIDVKIDKVKPTATLRVGSNKEYNSRDMYARIEANDDNSGVDKACFLINNSNVNNCEWVPIKTGTYYTYDYESWDPWGGHYWEPKLVTYYYSRQSILLPSVDGSGQVFTIYGYVKDKAGNISNVQSVHYQLYSRCSETNESYGSCNVSCGNGSQSITYTDKYLGTYCSTGSTTCNAGECHSDDGGGGGGGDDGGCGYCCGGSCECSGNMYTGVPDYGCWCPDGSWNGFGTC